MGKARLFKSLRFKIPIGMKMPSFVGSIPSGCPTRAEEVGQAQLCNKAAWSLRGRLGLRACFSISPMLSSPLLQVHSFKGYWEKLYANLEYAKYSKPHLHYHNSMVRREWHSLISEEVCVGS